jgi:hypothetical protein
LRISIYARHILNAGSMLNPVVSAILFYRRILERYLGIHLYIAYSTA